MAKPRIADSKAKYQRILAEYLRRRERVRKEFVSFDGKLEWKGSLKHREYQRKVWKINRMISVCRIAIKRYTIEDKNINSINKLVKDFLGVSVYRSSENNDLVYIDARNIFYKHCIEKCGIRSLIIGNFVGVSTNSVPRARMRFTRSFATKKTNKQLWESWKIFLNRQPEK